MTTTIAAIDLSDTTPGVLRAAARLGGRLVILHVAPPDPEYVTLRVGPEDERDAIAHDLRGVRRRLQDFGAELTGAGHAVDVLVVQGLAAERIIDEAIERDAALIVIGRHRHGALHDRLVGSVAEAVIRGAPCPVLVVPLGAVSTSAS